VVYRPAHRADAATDHNFRKTADSKTVESNDI